MPPCQIRCNVPERSRCMRLIIFALLLGNTAISQARLPQNPILTSASSNTIGTNINGPSLIRVPVWVEKPLGRYYLYFAHHAGKFIRLAYANQLSGPWTVYRSEERRVGKECRS